MATSMVQPLLFLPSQVTVHDEWSGTRRLQLAVLEEAVETMARARRAGLVRGHEAATARRAEDWMHSRSEDSPFSFAAIAAACRVSPEFLRRRIEAVIDSGTRPYPGRWKRERSHRARIVSGPIVAADQPELRREYARRAVEARRRRAT